MPENVLTQPYAPKKADGRCADCNINVCECDVLDIAFLESRASNTLLGMPERRCFARAAADRFVSVFGVATEENVSPALQHLLSRLNMWRKVMGV